MENGFQWLSSLDAEWKQYFMHTIAVPITHLISTLICAPFMSLSMRKYYVISGSYSYSYVLYVLKLLVLSPHFHF